MQEKTEFNFLLSWERQNVQLSQTVFGLPLKRVTWALGGVLLLGALAASPWAWQYKLQSDLARVNRAIAADQDVDELSQKASALRTEIQNDGKLQSIIARETHAPGPILEKLRPLLPPGSLIISFTLSPDNSLTLGISVPTPVDVARLWASLSAAGLFQSVDIQTVSLLDKAQTLNLNLKLK